MSIIDINVLLHQTPGGMLSNLVNQLRDMDALDKLDEVFRQLPIVRRGLGQAPLVTPTSQIVGTQAVLNVITGDRYKMVPKEVRDYVKGLYGKPPTMIDPKVRIKILCDEEPISIRPADLIQPEYVKARKELDALGLAKKEEDYLTYVLYPQVALKFLQGLAIEEPLAKKQLASGDVAFFSASLVTGAAVSLGGPGFVGIVVPHLVRLMVGADHRVVLPAATFSGAAFLVSCDVIARTPLAPMELPVGIITALIGGPFFLWLLLRKR